MEKRINTHHRKNLSFTPPRAGHRRTGEIDNVATMKTRSLDTLDEPVALLEK